MKFEDAQDIAYRFAAAAYMRKLTKLVGEAGCAQLANTASRHNAMLVVDEQAVVIKVTIECSALIPCGDFNALLKEQNRVTPR